MQNGWQSMARKKQNKEIGIPDFIFSRPPKTRDEAVARLHFHFRNATLHTEAVKTMDGYTDSHGLIPAYYFTINGRDQIKKALTKKDKERNKEIKNMKSNSEEDIKTDELLDSQVEEMIDTWDIVNCRHCGKKISMLTSRKISIGEDEYFICKSGH